MRSTVTGICYCTLHIIVYSLLYLCNFHYFQYFVIVRAHRKLVCWLLLGVVWINNLSIYLSNIPPLCTPWLFQKWVMAAFKRKPNGWCFHCQLQPSPSQLLWTLNHHLFFAHQLKRAGEKTCQPVIHNSKWKYNDDKLLR